MKKDLKPDQRLAALIVDDELSVLAVLTRVLEVQGFEVETALSGEEAISSFRSDYYSVVVTDVCMSGMSGFDLIEQIALKDNAVKTVVMTGYDSYEMVKNTLQSGAYDYFAKPLDNHEAISACVKRAAQATKLIRDNLELVAQLRASHELLARVNEQYRLLNEELRVQANTDSLTEIYNRRYIDQTLLREVNRRNRYPDPLSVVMLDIDHFKSFNDNYGHEGGDRVLKFIAQTLKDCSRNIDVVGRYGGEEFFVILPKTTPENALIFAERVRERINGQSIELASTQCKVSISAGVAGIDENQANSDVSMLVNAVDRALYLAKNSGRNRCCTGALEENLAGAEKRT